MITLEKPTKSAATPVSHDSKAKERERKALAIGYLEQISSLKIKLYSKLNCDDKSPSQIDVDYLAEITTCLSGMYESYSK